MSGSTVPSPHPGHATEPAHDWTDALEEALLLPVPPTGFWHRAGMSAAAERRLMIGLGVLLYALAVGWVYAITHLRTSLALGEDVSELPPAVQAAASVASGLTKTDAPSTAYLTDAALQALVRPARGISGALRANIDSANISTDTLPPGTSVRYSAGGEVDTTVRRPPAAGIWRVAIAVGDAIRPVADFSVITTLPFSAKRSGKIGLYFIGNWPAERIRGKIAPAKAPPSRYSNPAGFIEVTAESQDTYISEHFRLRDFLTHDQPNVWPKYLVLQLRLVDKLELVLQDLQSRGVDVRGVRVMSGFRTPRYNVSGGDPSGRAALSRHMYGDAADIFIDNGRGVMTDLSHDGKSTIADARVIEAAVNRVEAAHPELVGGVGVYPAAAGHGPFIHIDTRGYRARWIGGPGGG
jgi:uncharacterized protein YcbK (DUF882 family)